MRAGGKLVGFIGNVVTAIPSPRTIAPGAVSVDSALELRAISYLTTSTCNQKNATRICLLATSILASQATRLSLMLYTVNPLPFLGLRGSLCTYSITRRNVFVEGIPVSCHDLTTTCAMIPTTGMCVRKFNDYFYHYNKNRIVRAVPMNARYDTKTAGSYTLSYQVSQLRRCHIPHIMPAEIARSSSHVDGQRQGNPLLSLRVRTRRLLNPWYQQKTRRNNGRFQPAPKSADGLLIVDGLVFDRQPSKLV